MIYITHIVQKWHLEQNGSTATVFTHVVYMYRNGNCGSSFPSLGPSVHCRYDEFECLKPVCIPMLSLLDGYDDCPDKEDLGSDIRK